MSAEFKTGRFGANRRTGVLLAGVAAVAVGAALPANAQAATDQASFETALAGSSVTVTSSFAVVNPAATVTANPFQINLTGTAVNLSISGLNGAGGLDVFGSGDDFLTLGGTNSFSGGVRGTSITIIADGAAALGTGVLNFSGATFRANADFASANAIDLTSFGATIDTNGHALTLNGTITGGSGSVFFVTGGGVLTLTGTNSFTGQVTANTGTTIAFADAAALGAGGAINVSQGKLSATATTTLARDIVLQGGGGTLDAATGATLTLTGAVSGAGQNLAKTGPGTLVLAGANTYSGTTTVSGGTLQVGAGGTTGALGAGAVVNNAALAFNRSDAVTVGNAISGTGSLTQSGSGLLILNGTNAYTGATTVASGELRIGDDLHATAKITSDVAVASGATLSGHGSITGDVTNNGLVSPGGSIGVLTVNGAYGSNAASRLYIEVSPTAASQLKVNGAAALGGTLTLAYAPGVYTPRSYTLVQANALTGGFATISETGATPTGLTRTVSYGGGAATLTLDTPPPSPATPPAPVVVAPEDDAVFGSAQNAVALGGQQALGVLLERKADPADEACLPMPAAGPGQIDAQAAEALCARGGWVRASGAFAQVNGQGTNPGFTTRGGGFLAGLSRTVQGGVVGVAGGYTRTDLTDSDHGRALTDTARLAVYAARGYGPVALSAAASYAFNSVDTRRTTAVGRASAAFDVHEFDGGLQAAAPIRLGPSTLTPKAGLRYVQLLQNGFTEDAPAGFGVSARRDSLTSLQPFVGAALSAPVAVGGGVIRPEARVAYRRELLDTVRRLDVRSATGFDFVSSSTALGRDVFGAGVGATFVRAGKLAVSANYDVAFQRPSVDQTVSLGVRLRF